MEMVCGQRVVVKFHLMQYADIVFAVDSWAEMKQPDADRLGDQPISSALSEHAAPRIFDTHGDGEVVSMVAAVGWPPSRATTGSMTASSS